MQQVRVGVEGTFLSDSCVTGVKEADWITGSDPFTPCLKAGFSYIVVGGKNSHIQTHTHTHKNVGYSSDKV